MKKIVTKITGFILIFSMLLSVLGFVSVSAQVNTETYSKIESFDYSDATAILYDGQLWTVPTVHFSGYFGQGAVKNGELVLNSMDGIEFNWNNIPNISAYDSETTYTLEYDVKISDDGTGAQFSKTGWHRELCFGLAGYYTLADFCGAASNGTIQGIRTYPSSWDKSIYAIDSVYHVNMQWKGSDITTTIYDSDENMLCTGTRQFNYNDNKKYLDAFGWICEDGTTHIDNFKFSDGNVTYTQNFDTDLAPDANSYFYSDSSLWKLPAAHYSGKFSKGVVKNGELVLNSKQGVELKWTDIPGFETYDSSKTYTIAYDLMVSDYGSGALNSATNWHKELHYGFGGYYTLLDVCGPASNGSFSHGIRTQPGAWNQKLHTLNSVYRIVSEWKGSDITTTVYDSNDSVVVSGTRQFNYSTEASKKYLDYFSWLCDDGTIHIDNFSITDGTTTYTEDFELTATEYALSQGVWSAEDYDSSKKIAGTFPEVKEGAMYLTDGNAAQFNWTKLTEAGEYNSSNTYTFEFDMMVTDSGDGSTMTSSNTPRSTRVLYVAPGGWFDQVEINNKDGKIRTGDSSVVASYDESVFLNKNVHVSLVWKGTKITSTITDSEGTVLLTGSRTSSNYTNISGQYGAMQKLVLRCEDGAVTIDNFKFTVDPQIFTSETAVTDNSGAVIYDFDVDYSEGSVSFVEAVGNNSTDTVFEISDSGMSIAGYAVNGTFGAGEYNVRFEIVPGAYSFNVEVTAPDGTVIRRGDSNYLFGNTEYSKFINYSTSETAFVSYSVDYHGFTADSYTVNTTEPVYTGFDSKVYNLVTSYDGDAKTTRAFSWAALTEYVTSDETMAVRYRVKGTDDFVVVDAVRKNEVTEYETADFFEADITGLTAGTSYEYQIGKKGSSAADDWSDIYTFVTEKENTDEFSFVTVADTQGDGWSGRGFMYAESAIDAAFDAVGGNPDLMLHLGDVVETGGDYDMWKLYFKALGDHGKTTPHFAAVGNHEFYGHPSGENVGFNFNMHFNHPNNGGRNAIPLWANLGNYIQNIMNNPKEAAYSFDYGNAHFIVLATGASGGTDQYLTNSQKTWLTSDLTANADATWKIMVLHHPEYGWSTSSDRMWLAEIIESNGVDLVLQGHVHGNARSYPIKNGEVVRKNNPDVITKGEGTVYSILGSTTTNHQHVDETVSPNMLMAYTPKDEIPVYGYATVTDSTLTYTVKQLDGLVVDEFTIVNGNAVYKPETVGAQIRIANDEVQQGLRFISSIKSSAYEVFESAGLLPESSNDTGVGFGSVIIPKSYIPEGESLTKETTNARIVPAVNILKTVDDDVWFTVCLVNMVVDNYTTDYAVVPYVTYLDGDKEVTVYGDMITANVYDIAVLACKPDSPETDSARDYLQSNVIDKVDVWTDEIYRP